MSVPQSRASGANAQSLLSLIARISDASSASHTFAQTVQTAIAEICAYAGWPAGHAYLVDRSTEPPQLVSACDWYLARQSGLEALRKTGGIRFGLGEGLPGLVWERRHPLCLTRVRSMDSRFVRRPKMHVGAWFGFPVVFEDRVEAVVEFCNDEPLEIDPGLMRSSKSIGVLLSCALQQERQRYLNMVVEKAHDGVIVYTIDRSKTFPLTIAYVNSALERQSGYVAGELLGHPRHLLQGPHIEEPYARALVERLLDGETVQTDVLKYRKDGTTFWVEVTMRPLRDASGQVEYVVSVQRDITERKHAEQQLQMLSTALECASDMIAVMERSVHDRWRFCWVNEAFVTATGYAREEVLGRDSGFLEGPETDVERVREFRRETMLGHECRGEFAYYRKDGSLFWVDLNARPIVDGGGIATHTVVLYHDITAARERAQLLSYEAAHDPLTGLYNRRYFLQALESALRGSGERRRHALLFMDLDRFKLINDLHGHAAGDKLLAGIGQRLHATMREGDVFARVGGDEFAVLLHDCSPDAARGVAEHLLEVVRSFTLPFDSQKLQVGASIGIACGEAGSLEPVDALHRADKACYAAKHDGGNRAAMGERRPA